MASVNITGRSAGVPTITLPSATWAFKVESHHGSIDKADPACAPTRGSNERRFALMLRSVAAPALRRVSKHGALAARSGPTSSFETRARKSMRAPQDEVGTKTVPSVADEVIE